MPGKSIVRDIYVSVPRIDEHSASTGMTAYIFAVRPRPSLLASLSTTRSREIRRRLSMAEPTRLSIEWRDTITGRRNSDSSACMTMEGPRASSFIHEVSRTYAQCRTLYRQLLAITDCRSMETCGCVLGSCPFWSMHTMLKAFPFPRHSLLSLHWTQKSITTHRLLAFNQFMASLIHHFQLYREDFFLDRLSSTEIHGCKVIRAVEGFLELSEEVVDRFHEAECRQQLKMNLRGWQSDRKNLYFAEENSDNDNYDAIGADPIRSAVTHSTSTCETQYDSLGVDVNAVLYALAHDNPIE